MTFKTYSELRNFTDFKDRFEYLKLDGDIGRATFGFDRWINQRFYSSWEWRRVRDAVVVRDNGCDLGVPGYEIYDGLLVHHINPMNAKDIVHGERLIFDMENLITTTRNTHNAIHFGNDKRLPDVVMTRSPNDTSLW